MVAACCKTRLDQASPFTALTMHFPALHMTVEELHAQEDVHGALSLQLILHLPLSHAGVAAGQVQPLVQLPLTAHAACAQAGGMAVLRDHREAHAEPGVAP